MRTSKKRRNLALLSIGLFSVAIFIEKKVDKNQNKIVLSDLAKANIAALAENEGGAGSGSGYCTMHIPCFNQYGNPTGMYTASSYQGPGCSGSYHSHGCENCNK